VIQSLRGRVGPGDALFSLDIGYGSVKKMLQVGGNDHSAHSTSYAPSTYMLDGAVAV
jgi:hypothetical protein